MKCMISKKSRSIECHKQKKVLCLYQFNSQKKKYADKKYGILLTG